MPKHPIQPVICNLIGQRLVVDLAVLFGAGEQNEMHWLRRVLENKGEGLKDRLGTDDKDVVEHEREMSCRTRQDR